MPLYRSNANTDLEQFVGPIVGELMAGAQPTPTDPLASPGESPVIIENPSGLGEKFRVTVVWDKWGGLPVEDRNKIIMEAYRRVHGAEAVNISLILGVTRLQFQQMSSSLGQLTGI